MERKKETKIYKFTILSGNEKKKTTGKQTITETLFQFGGSDGNKTAKERRE